MKNINNIPIKANSRTGLRAISLALICTALLALFAACGGDKSTSTSSQSQSSESQNQGTDLTNSTSAPAGPVDGYAFEAKGVKIKMGENMSNLSALGEANDVFEAPSCAFDGVDKIFYFNGYQVYTYPGGEDDFVLSVSLEDDTLTTPEGAYIGMDTAAVKEKHGEPTAEDTNQISYVSGDTELVFMLESGTVVDISYYLASQKDNMQ